jgi:mannitol/fructose-specific phosphotransferase system IIA component (Ntr-type)/CBS domain-containing protein
MIVGEQVPKYIALSKAEGIILFFALPLKIFYKLTYYPMIVINSSSEFIVRLLGLKKQSEDERMPSEDEIRLILSQSEELGKISLQRLLMFDHLFDFGKTSVKEIMISSDKIISVDINSKFEDIVDVVNKFKFSRYPVKEENKYTGYIHIKDIILNYNSFKSEGFKLKNFVKEIKFLKEKMPVERALRYFQENQIQISLIENDNGNTVGLLSVEDIIEDLVGEIRDEFEKRPAYRLDSILNKEASIISLRAGDRFGAINEMIDKLDENKLVLNKYEIMEKIIKREKSFSTAIGHQIAIPHARIDGLKRPLMTVAMHYDGIAFPSPDNKNVRIIFMILTPYNDPSIQLNILSKISKLISNVTLRRKLFKSQSIDKVLEVLTTFEDSMPLD